MSVFRFFSSYLPKPDKNLALVRNIFEIPLNNNTETNEEVLIPNYPKSNPLDSFSKKLIPQILVDTLNLKLESHTLVIKDICEKLENKDLDEKLRINIGILAIRSCCSLLFTSLDKLDPDTFGYFMKSLMLATQFYPNQNYITELFFSIFERLMTIDQIPRILEYLEILQKNDLLYSDKGLNFFVTHSSITLNLIGEILKQTEIPNQRLISTHFFFTACILNKSTNPDKQTVLKLSQGVMKLVEHLIKHPAGITFSCAVLMLMISLRKHTVFDCSPYMEILRRVVQKNTLFASTVDEALFVKEPLHKLELKFQEKKFNYVFDFDTLTQFEDLFSLKEAETNPLLLFSKETGTQMQNTDFETFSHILKPLMMYIGDSGLNIYAITVIIISQLPLFANELGDYFVENDSFDLFFPHALFNPSINSYMTPTSPLLNLRKQLFEMLTILLENPNTIIPIRKSIYNLLSLITTHSALFSDVMTLCVQHLTKVFAAQWTDDGLWEVIFNAMIIQQEHHFAGDELALKYRPHLFSSVTRILNYPTAIARACESKFACQAGAHFLFEESAQLIFIKMIQTIIGGIANDPNDRMITNFSKVIHELIVFLLPSIKNPRSFDLLLTLMTTICNTLTKDIEIMSLFNNKTFIVQDMISILLNLPPFPKAPMALRVGFDLLLIIQQTKDFIFEKIPFVSLAQVVSRTTIDDKMYNKIVSIISGGDVDFDRIAIPEAIPLLVFSTKGTPKYRVVLEDLIKFCNNSVSNRCACIAGGLPAMLFETCTDEDFDVALQLFEIISRSACTHKALLSFFRQFSSLKGKTFNKKTFACVQTLTNILKIAESPQHFSMLLFSSEFSRIKAPPLLSKDTQEDFMISSTILLDATNSGRFFFEFRTDDNKCFEGRFIDNKFEISLDLKGNHSKSNEKEQEKEDDSQNEHDENQESNISEESTEKGNENTEEENSNENIQSISEE